MGEYIELNIIPFICEAIGHNKLIYGDIDKIYSKNKTFYKLAKENEFYNNIILTDNDFIKEEYAKKILGIILYIMNDNDENETTGKALYALLEKGWKYTYAYVQNNNVFELSHFLKAFNKKIGGIANIQTDEFNHNILIAFFLSNNMGKKIIENEPLYEFKKMLYNRQIFSSDNSIKIHLPDADDTENLEAIKELKNRLLDNKSSLVFDTVYSKYTKNHITSIINYIFDYEEISTSICDGRLSSKEIDEMLWAIKIVNDDDLEGKFIVSSYIRLMLKKFKELKKHYLENNKETMFIELDEKENENQRLKSEIETKKADIKKLESELKRKDKEIKQLKKEIADNKTYKREIISLRNNFFTADAEADPTPGEEINYSDLATKKYLFLGGRDSLVLRLKEIFPNAIFIDTNNNNFNANLLNNATKVVIFSNYLNHPFYYKCMNTTKTLNKSVLHISTTNVDLILQKLL